MERTSSMLDKIESKTMHKDKKNMISSGKRSKTLSEVKPAENTSKNLNLQSFLEISLVQKEVFPSHIPQDHEHE